MAGPLAPSEFEPGQIYRIHWEGDETKYVLVVSRTELNRGNGLITVMFTTKKLAARALLPSCVYFEAGEFGLTEPCVAKCDSIAYTHWDEIDLSKGLIGKVDDDHWREVVMALGHVFDAECSPL